MYKFFTTYLLNISTQYSGYNANVDLSIEGMRSQKFGYGIFVFLMVGIAVFCGIIFATIREQMREGKMRTGEKIMFGAIIMGVVVAVIFGGAQLLNGFLF
ncbi:hypothetical protein LHV13_01680 [Ferrovum sp. PN-J185]|uniref:hypothetical protein n=1 Tax=Ferrovum sp. PN-J185 TaxID=1356306 RepID=UPI000799CB97|nr:hypothetical protein [Ferrovum sp. PN-J185]KXW55553.1 hypothetical protein FV185_13210 [Ferrovum sp. PN-J185]MCC6067891.1 hypothetical protein [Ferrovum sp. PN-J185]MDE1891234.1 hypothetical protein [Betaproteobacteria bacterium]MDE2056274.1 hypothetical protein [Betaproteobacteria bacterium]